MALTANDQFLDALIRHQIGLLRLSGSIRNDVYKLLDATEKDIAEKTRQILSNHRGFDSPASVARMNRLIKIIKSTRLQAWKEVDELWLKEMVNLSNAEPQLINGILKTVVPVTLETTLPATELLTALVKTKPFQGKTLRGWSKNIAVADINRLEAQIRIGMVNGEGSAAIARRLVGTVAQKGRNGVTEITRRQADAITRTAVNAFSNQAKREFYMANDDIIKKEKWVSTLDSRTTPVCMSLDGRIWLVGEGRYPPAHMQCRSLRVGIIDNEAIGRRPTRAFTEKQLLREFTKEQKLPTVANRSKLPRGTKGKFDDFSQVRKRQLTGTTPAKTTYQEFLNRQSAAFQDDVLGKTKGRLFRRGGLKLDKFVDRTGAELNLSELAGKHAEAFRAAGLNPENFL